MVTTTDISQLSAECNSWRQTMRNYREAFTQLKKNLQQVAGRISQKDLLQEVEHYHNQFHIQLINIHDVKHQVKAHDQKISHEMANGPLSDESLSEHEELHDSFESLCNGLEELKADFDRFLKKVP